MKHLLHGCCTCLQYLLTHLLTHSLTHSLTCSLSSVTGLPGLAQLPGKISSIICSSTSRSYSALSLAYYLVRIVSIMTIYTGQACTTTLC